MKTSAFVLLLFLQLTAQSQNLIRNGDFEIYQVPADWIPQKANTDSLDNWGNYGHLNLHLHNYCGGRAFNGSGYIDLRLYSHHEKNYREYAEAKISCPLQAGARYIIHFRTMPIKGKFVIGDIGAFLSKVPVEISVHKLLSLKPAIISEKGKLIDNSHQYTLVEDTIMANGGEQYLIIGNFEPDNQLPKREFHDFDSINKPLATPYSAIYGFDDIALIPLNPNECPQAHSQSLPVADSVNHTDTIFTLTDIHFATNSSVPVGQFSALYKLVSTLLSRDTSLAVKVSGYTDAVGTKAYNLELSLKRAEAIGKQLNGMGIDCRKIYIDGYGSESPVENSAESLMNRRVELNIAPSKNLQTPGTQSFCKNQK